MDLWIEVLGEVKSKSPETLNLSIAFAKWLNWNRLTWIVVFAYVVDATRPTPLMRIDQGYHNSLQGLRTAIRIKRPQWGIDNELGWGFWQSDNKNGIYIIWWVQCHDSYIDATCTRTARKNGPHLERTNFLRTKWSEEAYPSVPLSERYGDPFPVPVRVLRQSMIQVTLG